MFLFLRSWWSKTYNRPQKDPLLDQYSMEELLYEFFDTRERVKAAELRAEEERDRIEDEKNRSALDWAEQEERRELEARKVSVKDEAWMQEQLDKEKQVFGDDYGEDLNLDFTRDADG